MAYVVGLTPNQVTGLSAIASLSAVPLIAWPAPSLAAGFAATALLLLGYALDSADGQLARLTGRSTPSGEWLDHVVDTAKIVLVHGAVLVSWSRWDAPLSWWMAALPLLYILASQVAFFGWQLARLLPGEQGQRSPVEQTSAPALRSLLRSPSDWGVLCLTFLVWSTPLFTVGYALLVAANLAITAVALPTWFRQASGAGL